MEMTDTTFAPRHAGDRTFFLAIAGIAWVVILGGFVPELVEHGQGSTAFPSALVLVHGAVFFAWLGLFTVQVLLIRSRRIGVHRALGMGAMAMVPLMVVLGLEANIDSQRAHFAAGESELDFMIVPITDMVVFAALAGTGLWLRKHPAAHKRLMLLATVSLLDPGSSRWFGDWIHAQVGDGFFGFIVEVYLCFDLLVVAAMIYDRVTRGRIHPVYRIAFPLMIADQLISSAIYRAPGWIPIARYLIS